MRYKVEAPGERLTKILLRHYGRTLGPQEIVLDGNPHLAIQGPVLPTDLEITLPDIPKPSSDKVARGPRLFD